VNLKNKLVKIAGYFLRFTNKNSPVMMTDVDRTEK